MGAMAGFLQKLETYTDLEGSIIRSTKIHKVLKAILKLNSIPRDEELKFRERAVDILGKWKHLLDSDLPSAGAENKEDKEGETETEKPTANGVHKKQKQVNGKSEEKGDEEDEGAASAQQQASANNDEDVPMPDADDNDKAEETKATEKKTEATEEGNKSRSGSPAAEKGKAEGETEENAA